jgi:hypothetical protein
MSRRSCVDLDHVLAMSIGVQNLHAETQIIELCGEILLEEFACNMPARWSGSPAEFCQNKLVPDL